MVLYCTMCKIWKLYVLDIFRLGPSHSGHSKSAPASWAMPADTEKKSHRQFPSRCGMLGSIWFFRCQILLAVNPNFNCLILCDGVTYAVILVHIGPTFGKIQPIQCALHNKIARVCFSFKYLCIFFAFYTKYIFFNNCNCSLNNEYYSTIFRLYRV